jgi:hypothetical protein
MITTVKEMVETGDLKEGDVGLLFVVGEERQYNKQIAQLLTT